MTIGFQLFLLYLFALLTTLPMARTLRKLRSIVKTAQAAITWLFIPAGRYKRHPGFVIKLLRAQRHYFRNKTAQCAYAYDNDMLTIFISMKEKLYADTAAVERINTIPKNVIEKFSPDTSSFAIANEEAIVSTLKKSWMY
jgi:hypothetical protein